MDKLFRLLYVAWQGTKLNHLISATNRRTQNREGEGLKAKFRFLQ